MQNILSTQATPAQSINPMPHDQLGIDRAVSRANSPLTKLSSTLCRVESKVESTQNRGLIDWVEFNSSSARYWLYDWIIGKSFTSCQHASSYMNYPCKSSDVTGQCCKTLKSVFFRSVKHGQKEKFLREKTLKIRDSLNNHTLEMTCGRLFGAPPEAEHSRWLVI